MMCIIKPENKYRFRANDLDDAEKTIAKWCKGGVMPGHPADYVIGEETLDDGSLEHWAVKVR